MKLRSLLIVATISVATLISSRADEPARKKLAQSIPDVVAFCGRLELNIAWKNHEAEDILAATTRQFQEQLDGIGQFSGLDLGDVDCIWVCVVKDEEVLVIFEGTFDTELILNSPVVINSRNMARPGTVVAIEMPDEKKGGVNHAVVINDNVIAFGRPQLVDKFTINYVNNECGWDENGLAVMDRLATSDAMLHVAVIRLPDNEIKQKPFLANLVNAQMELTLNEQVTTTIRITMQDEEKATALRNLISGFVTLGLTSEIKMSFPEVKAAILDGLALSNDGRTVTLSSSIDIEQLRDLLMAKGLELN